MRTQIVNVCAILNKMVVESQETSEIMRLTEYQSEWTILYLERRYKVQQMWMGSDLTGSGTSRRAIHMRWITPQVSFRSGIDRIEDWYSPKIPLCVSVYTFGNFPLREPRERYQHDVHARVRRPADFAGLTMESAIFVQHHCRQNVYSTIALTVSLSDELQNEKKFFVCSLAKLLSALL